MSTEEFDHDADVMNELPVVYSIALRLRASDIPASTVAVCLDVDIAALPLLYAVADAKLAYLRRRRRGVN
jgi:hypothetical protein